MSKLYFITHPSVQIIKNQSIDQWGLSDKGIDETRGLLKLDFWNEINVVYSSPEKKAVQTAQLVSSECKLEICLSDCLSEVDRSSTGFIDYDKYIEAIKNFYNRPDESIQGWESANNATKRITECVKSIMSNHKDQTVAIVGHGATGTLLVCSLLNKKPDFTEDPQGTGRYMIINWDKRQIIQKWLTY